MVLVDVVEADLTVVGVVKVDVVEVNVVVVDVVQDYVVEVIVVVVDVVKVVGDDYLMNDLVHFGTYHRLDLDR